MTDADLYPFRLFGIAMTLFMTLCGLAVVLRPEKKIIEPGHRVGNFIIWMLGKNNGMKIIRTLGWVMLIGGGVGLISVGAAFLNAYG
jgi:hypothetical protein